MHASSRCLSDGSRKNPSLIFHTEKTVIVWLCECWNLSSLFTHVLAWIFSRILWLNTVWSSVDVVNSVSNNISLILILPYILAYKSHPCISRPPKNRVHMLSKITDPCISRRYSKLTTCCIIVWILGGFYDAQLKCSIVWRSLSLRRSSHFRQMWLQLTRPPRPAIGADIIWHTGLLVAAKPETAAAGVLY